MATPLNKFLLPVISQSFHTETGLPEQVSGQRYGVSPARRAVCGTVVDHYEGYPLTDWRGRTAVHCTAAARQRGHSAEIHESLCLATILQSFDEDTPALAFHLALIR